MRVLSGTTRPFEQFQSILHRLGHIDGVFPGFLGDGHGNGGIDAPRFAVPGGTEAKQHTLVRDGTTAFDRGHVVEVHGSALMMPHNQGFERFHVRKQGSRLQWYGKTVAGDACLAPTGVGRIQSLVKVVNGKVVPVKPGRIHIHIHPVRDSPRYRYPGFPGRA